MLSIAFTIQSDFLNSSTCEAEQQISIPSPCMELATNLPCPPFCSQRLYETGQEYFADDSVLPCPPYCNQKEGIAGIESTTLACPPYSSSKSRID